MTDEETAYFPGSRTLRRTTAAAKREPTPGEGWDTSPRYLPYKGQTIAVFPVGAFAKALNRSVITIRAMERKGIIPKPALKERHGEQVRRVYTREQIEQMILLAADEGCLDPRATKKFSATFIREAHRILRRKPHQYD